MQRVTRTLSLAILLCLGISLAVGAQDRPGDPTEGTWTLRPDEEVGQVHLRLDLDDEGTVEFDLPWDHIERAGTTFVIRREAGTYTLRGDMKQRRGQGSFRFTPNEAYREGLRSRGLRLDDPCQLLVLAAYESSLDHVDSLQRQGIRLTSGDDLVQVAIFDVSPVLVGQLRGAGLDDLTLEDLVQARIFDIDAAFLASLHELEVGPFSMDEVVALRVHDVDPAFIAGARELGLAPTMEELVELQIFNVTPAFVEEMTALGYDDLDVQDYVEFRIFGIDRQYVEKQQKALGRLPSPGELVEAKVMGRSVHRTD